MNENYFDSIYEDILNDWRNNKGVGSVSINYPMNYVSLCSKLLMKMYTRSPDMKCLIILSSFRERMEFIDYITDENNTSKLASEFRSNISNRKIKIYSIDYSRDYNFDDCSLIIVGGVTKFNRSIYEKIEKIKFSFVCLTSEIKDNAMKARLYKVCPLIKSITKNDMLKINSSLPVEEMLQAAEPLSDDDLSQLAKYDEYISQSLNIFGSFDIMQQCRTGNHVLNISSASIRMNIAKENGWSENLDMSVEFNRMIDSTFNPNVLLDRSEITYDIIRKRSNLLTDNKCKLKSILDICLENKDKQILIINKRADFASEVTEYLKQNGIKCENYHDKVEPIPATDENGFPIFVKTGNNAGKRKMLACAAQQKLFANRFRYREINVLSTSNSPNKDLECYIDLMIITSPLCDDIRSIKYRLQKVTFTTIPNKVILLYCANSYEETKMRKMPPIENVAIKDDINFEKNFAFTIAD